MTLPIGTIKTPNGLLSGLWALPRPLTKKWGSGALVERIKQTWGPPDIVFGKQDQVSGPWVTVDKDSKVKPTIVADWCALPFKDKSFKFSYWDPPYLGYVGKDGDVHYNRMDNCLREICRVSSERIVILSPLIYPCPENWKRDAVISCTYGPNKIIRAVQSFVRK